VTAVRSRLAVAGTVLAAACASTGTLVTVQLPPGFEGTWVRNPAASHVDVGDLPGPDTIRLAHTATYHPRRVIPDKSDSIVGSLLALPDGPQLANKIDVVGSGELYTVTKRVTVHADTVLVESDLTKPYVGLVGRVTTREHLAPGQNQLIAETTSERPAYDQSVLDERRSDTTGTTRRLLVYDRAQ
jgi:hypothetical protein